jgi:hypothetical protein
MKDEEVTDVLRSSLTAYETGDLNDASILLNKVHVEVYESSKQFHDMIPVNAVSVLGIIRADFPDTIDKGTDSWNRAFSETMRAIRDLCEEYLSHL